MVSDKQQETTANHAGMNFPRSPRSSPLEADYLYAGLPGSRLAADFVKLSPEILIPWTGCKVASPEKGRSNLDWAEVVP